MNSKMITFLQSYHIYCHISLFQAGPSGSQFAVLACMCVEVFRWSKDNKPGRTILRLFILLVILLLVGLLPMVDNYAHVAGFIYGLLLSIGFRPYKSLCKTEISRMLQWAMTAVCLLVAALLFAVLVAFFYEYQITECENCSYFNCIPITDTLCEGMHIKIDRLDEAGKSLL